MVHFLCTDGYMNIWIHSHCIEWNINRIDGRLLEAVVLKYRKIKLNRYKAQLIKPFPFLLALKINARYIARQCNKNYSYCIAKNFIHSLLKTTARDSTDFMAVKLNFDRHVKIEKMKRHTQKQNIEIKIWSLVSLAAFVQWIFISTDYIHRCYSLTTVLLMKHKRRRSFSFEVIACCAYIVRLADSPFNSLDMYGTVS